MIILVLYYSIIPTRGNPEYGEAGEAGRIKPVGWGRKRLGSTGGVGIQEDTARHAVSCYSTVVARTGFSYHTKNTAEQNNFSPFIVLLLTVVAVTATLLLLILLLLHLLHLLFILLVLLLTKLFLLWTMLYCVRVM